MSRRATLPAIRPDVLESLVHPIPVNRVGGNVQLVVRVSVGTDDDSSAIEDPVEAVLAEVSPMPQRPAAAGHADLVGFCAELTRADGDDDLAGAISLIATVADCPAALLRADRSVLTVGEPRRAARNGTPSPAARSWRWAANGPQGDREIAIESATHRLGVLTSNGRSRTRPNRSGGSSTTSWLWRCWAGTPRGAPRPPSSRPRSSPACPMRTGRTRAPPGRARSPTGLPSSPPSTASPGRRTRWPA